MSTPTLLFDRIADSALTADVGILLSSRLLVQANSGGGKSRAIRSLLEQTHGKVQHIVLDPEGEFATLREKFSYVLAGVDGDVPAHPKVAKVLCRRLIELGASAIVDLYDLSLIERREFVKLFLQELMSLPRSLWKPVLVVIDEAHNFAPQSGEAQSTEAVITLCTQGRKRGFCAVLATQRISKLHKDAAAELNNKLIGRTGLDVDQKRAADDLGFDKEQRIALRDLPAGSFYAFGPAMGNGVQLVRSAPVVTTHPDANTIGRIAVPANADVQSLVSQIGDLPQLANKEADERIALQNEVKQLRAQLRAKAPAVAQRVEVKIDASAEQIARAKQEGFENGKAVVLYRLRNVVEDFDGEARTLLPEVVAPIVTRAAPLPVSGTRRELSAPATATPSALSRTQLKMLNAMAAMERIGIAPSTRAQLGAWVGVSSDTGTFRNNLSEMRTAGVIEDVSRSELNLTDIGRGAAEPDNTPIKSRADLHALVTARVSRTQANMLDIMISEYPRGVSRAAIASILNVSHDTGTFRNNLSELRTLKFITDVDRSTVRASSWLFPEGLS